MVGFIILAWNCFWLCATYIIVCLNFKEVLMILETDNCAKWLQSTLPDFSKTFICDFCSVFKYLILSAAPLMHLKCKLKAHSQIWDNIWQMKAPPPQKWLFLFHLNPNLEGVGWWFSLNFAALSNILLETFVANSVSITRRSLQILCKTQTRVFPISVFLVNPLSKKIVIIPEPVMILT